ncbi:MAG: hypothetical protein EOO09_15805 [Chitinophagaceae bacterium]|nr:MAG: hypothetical protein EOO09_15805 [Chitinophagaceae bacterium]
MAEITQPYSFYLEKFRTFTNRANFVLGICLIIFLTNWLFAVEPKFQTLKVLNKLYKAQLSEAKRNLIELSNEESSLTNQRLIDSMKNEEYIFRRDRLTDTLSRTNLGQGNYQELSKKIDEYAFNKAARITLFEKSNKLRLQIDSLKSKKAYLDTVKNNKSLEAIDKYDWTSLIKFVFIVASNPREGGLYLCALLTFISAFTYTARLWSLRHVSKAIRLYKLGGQSPLVQHDLSISTPFWITPVPFTQSTKSASDKIIDNRVEYRELSKFLGIYKLGRRYSFFTFAILIFMICLQLRLFYIAIVANPAVRFDLIFIFSVGFILASVGILFLWMLPIQIDDHLNDENPSEDFGRRIFVSAAATFVVLLAFGRKKEAIAKYFQKHAKRFKRHKRRRVLASGTSGSLFVRRNNDPTNANLFVYSFDDKGYSPILNSIRNEFDRERFQENLIKTEISKCLDPLVYLFKSNQIWNIENYVLMLFEAKKANQAMEYLYRNVTDRWDFRYDIRLWDFSMKIFARFDRQNQYFEQALAEFEKDTEALDVLLTARKAPKPDQKDKLILRIAKWRDPKWKSTVQTKKTFRWNNHQI